MFGGRYLLQILFEYPDLGFYFNWLSKINIANAPNTHEEWQEYLILKSKVSRTPGAAIDSKEETFLYNLVKDFLNGLRKPSFLPKIALKLVSEGTK